MNSPAFLPAPKPHWHWPHFAEVLCGNLNDRERLGLPEHFVELPLIAQVQAAMPHLAGVAVSELAAWLEDAAVPLAERIAAGNWLALLGDPRLLTEEPAMVRIPGGEVSIGLDITAVDAVLAEFDGLGLNRDWIKKECPRHRVTLAPYRIARYPVTNAEYCAFLLDSGHPEIPSSWAFRQYPLERANHPVYTVSPAAADAYASWLSARTGRRFRLPTEAEWEYAASGPEGLAFPWGRDFDADLANTAESGLLASSPVGAFVGGESPFGLADMAGNVEEYVSDNYAAYPGGGYVVDHLVEIHGQYRVARGGSFARFRDLARNCRRHGHNPRSVTYVMGFRLAESA